MHKDIAIYINSFLKEKPKACLMLGSGLDKIINNFESKIIIPYTDIPNFYNTGVEGHKGEFIYGYIKNTPILCARGRFHYYEGFNFDEIGSIIEVFNYFKPKLSIITNSSGCLNLDWEIGNFMIADKFLDFSFINSGDFKLYQVKNNQENKKAITLAKNNDIKLYEGTYTFTTGPSYETKAEIEEIISIGGNAVGMSTFPEFLKTKKLKMNTIFISCLTNYGAGLIKEKITHEDVLKNAKKSKHKFCKLITKLIESI